MLTVNKTFIYLFINIYYSAFNACANYDITKHHYKHTAAYVESEVSWHVSFPLLADTRPKRIKWMSGRAFVPIFFGWNGSFFSACFSFFFQLNVLIEPHMRLSWNGDSSLKLGRGLSWPFSKFDWFWVQNRPSRKMEGTQCSLLGVFSTRREELVENVFNVGHCIFVRKCWFFSSCWYVSMEHVASGDV